MITKQDIISELQRLGLQLGMEIEVHSSLKSFGYVDGGANTVISALKELVGLNGSIFMPAMRLSREIPLTEQDKNLGIRMKLKILSEQYDHSGMGIIADAFRKMPDTCIGEDIFRVAAWGRSANEVATGLNYLISNGGKALLLGVDIYRLTAMHYVESILPKAIKDKFKPSEEINKIYPPEKWFIETWSPPAKPWYVIQDIAYKKGLIRDGLIGNCNIMFFDILDIVSLYERELKNNPYELYGLEGYTE